MGLSGFVAGAFQMRTGRMATSPPRHGSAVIRPERLAFESLWRTAIARDETVGSHPFLQGLAINWAVGCRRDPASHLGDLLLVPSRADDEIVGLRAYDSLGVPMDIGRVTDGLLFLGNTLCRSGTWNVVADFASAAILFKDLHEGAVVCCFEHKKLGIAAHQVNRDFRPNTLRVAFR